MLTTWTFYLLRDRISLPSELESLPVIALIGTCFALALGQASLRFLWFLLGAASLCPPIVELGTILGFLIGLFGVVGDLFESFIKR